MPFDQEESMLVVVHLLDEQVLARLEIHHMDVEVIVSSLREELAECKDFRCRGKEGGVLHVTIGEGWGPPLDGIDPLIDQEPSPIERGEGGGIAGREVCVVVVAQQNDRSVLRS